MYSPHHEGRFRSRLNLSGGKDRVVLVVALGILSAVSPRATDMYLASMPRMAGYFETPTSAVQLTLTTYMIGMALGQFLLGPISDVLGRHRLMVAAMCCSCSAPWRSPSPPASKRSWRCARSRACPGRRAW
jgi:DHA1 family bicyclomycin/chloramphenicol resistance-like MFS transporter